MILSRRKIHYYASVALACTLPILFLLGILCRPPIPIVDESADKLFAIANFSTTPLTPEQSETLSGGGTQIQVDIATTANGATVLEIQPVQAIQFSDVLVYWQAGDRPTETESAETESAETASTDTDALIIADTAVLLGQLSGTSRRRFSLPPDIQGQDGNLILYSRGRNTLIVILPLTLSAN